MAMDTAALYKHVIEDVVKSVRDEFIKDEVDESILQQLQELWEQKLNDSGAVEPPDTTAGPKSANSKKAKVKPDDAGEDDGEFGKPAKFMPPGKTYGEDMKLKLVPDMNLPPEEDDDEASASQSSKRKRGDEEEDLDGRQGDGDGGGGASASGRSRGGGGEDDDEDDLEDSDLDDDDDDDEKDKAETNISNVLLAQFEKVGRTKNKWKCSLKDGVIHVNGKDVIFHKATGEFEW